ncbi:MAG: hypothetical protein KH047_08950 [Eubacterium sp.]|nr:hypothetical protein [Eubacterium sp.]
MLKQERKAEFFIELVWKADTIGINLHFVCKINGVAMLKIKQKEQNKNTS